MTESIKSKIRTIPHWPKKNIMFRDITTLLKSPEGLKETIDLFHERYVNKKIDTVIGIEARGFIMGGALSSGWLDWGNNNIKFKGLANPEISYEDAARNMQALHSAFTGTFEGMTAKGAVDPGSQLGQGVIDSMIIDRCIGKTDTIIVFKTV